MNRVGNRPIPTAGASAGLSVALLTGGSDKPYVDGITQALSSVGIGLDVIGSDELDDMKLRNRPGVNFLNLRGDQRPNARLAVKIFRILAYYWRLIRYAAKSKPRIFHILWNNKFEALDRTLLMMYYKLLGKAIVLTAHNVNKAKRDAKDTIFNRLTLRTQYHLTDHIFVHTAKMKDELVKDFSVREDRIAVVPFGINNSVPNTALSPKEAKEWLGVSENAKTILYFGRIKQYKGVEYLIRAFQRIAPKNSEYKLIIAGRLEEGCEGYWDGIKKEISDYVKAGQIITRIEFIPDSETEMYFKGADVIVLPYKEIFQSGLIVLAYSFGLPVVAADVGSLKEDILEGSTGFVFRPEDPDDLAMVIEQYFASDLFANLQTKRQEIQDHAMRRHSWDVVGQATVQVYASLLRNGSHKLQEPEPSRVPKLH